ncbi:MAG: hypothetical protein JJV88_05155 [Sulfurovum sp.]|nr:hypothetical protein [Sulfurovaceae bacterium]
MINYKQREAVAMIELVFAIVIIGFAMMSIPNLLGLSARSGYTALQQEAIATASSDISLIFARQWDESNTLSDDYERVLRTHGDASLNDRNGGVTRIYNIPSPITATSISFLGADLDENGNNDSDDIDDANGDTSTMTNDLEINTKTGSIDQHIRITTDVYYISDREKIGRWNSSRKVVYNYSSPSDIRKITNIKNIITTLTSNSGVKELEKHIVLSAFSCNIGGYKRDRKVLP